MQDWQSLFLNLSSQFPISGTKVLKMFQAVDILFIYLFFWLYILNRMLVLLYTLVVQLKKNVIKKPMCLILCTSFICVYTFYCTEVMTSKHKWERGEGEISANIMQQSNKEYKTQYLCTWYFEHIYCTKVCFKLREIQTYQNICKSKSIKLYIQQWHTESSNYKNV